MVVHKFKEDPILAEIEHYHAKKHRPRVKREKKLPQEKHFYIVIDGHTQEVVESEIPTGYKGIKREIKNPS